jgi:hypothetical protein
MSTAPVGEESPDVAQISDALSIACIGLRLIMSNAAADDQDVARKTLTAIQRMLPAAYDHIPPEELAP